MSDIPDWSRFFIDCGIPTNYAFEYSQLFITAEMDEDSIYELNHAAMIDLGIKKTGHRFKVLRMQRNIWIPSTGDIKENLESSGDSLDISDSYSDRIKGEEIKNIPAEDIHENILPVANADSAKSTLSHSERHPHPHHEKKNSNSKSESALVVMSPQTYTDLADSNGKDQGSIKRAQLKKEAAVMSNLGTVLGVGMPYSPEGSTGQLGYQIHFYINDDPHRLGFITKTGGPITLQEFRQQASQLFKSKILEEWALFCPELESLKLQIVKEGHLLSSENDYYVISLVRIQSVTKKIEKTLKKDIVAKLQRTPGGKPVYTSLNHPIQVDYIPDSALLMNQTGKIGICMAPGRTKKKKIHDWERDLNADLDRIKNHFKCDVLVSLIRLTEMIDIHTPTLLKEVEGRGMEPIHFPIKDKWVPDSMTRLMDLVQSIKDRLQEGKKVVVHCNGGKGRSGTVAVATLVACGVGVQQSIDIVRKTRSGTIRNPLQIAYVKRFKTAWLRRKKLQPKLDQEDAWVENDDGVDALMDPEEEKMLDYHERHIKNEENGFGTRSKGSKIHNSKKFDKDSDKEQRKIEKQKKKDAKRAEKIKREVEKKAKKMEKVNARLGTTPGKASHKGEINGTPADSSEGADQQVDTVIEPPEEHYKESSQEGNANNEKSSSREEIIDISTSEEST